MGIVVFLIIFWPGFYRRWTGLRELKTVTPKEFNRLMDLR